MPKPRSPNVKVGDVVKLTDRVIQMVGGRTRKEIQRLLGEFTVVKVEPPMEIGGGEIVYDVWLEPDWINDYVGIDDTNVKKVV